MTPREKAMAIVHDLMDRRGLKQAWEQVDGGVRADIVNAWEAIIAREPCDCALPGAGSDPDSYTRFRRADRCAKLQQDTKRENGVCMCPCHQRAPR